MGRVESAREVGETVGGVLRKYLRTYEKLVRDEAPVAQWWRLHNEIVRTFIDGQRLLNSRHSVTRAALRADALPERHPGSSAGLVRQLERLAELMHSVSRKIRELEHPIAH